MDKVYLYDGSFVGLLNLILELIKMNERPYNIKDELYSSSLFETLINFDIPWDASVLKNMRLSFGKYALDVIYYVFLSEENNKELIIYYFVLNAIKFHKNIVYRRDLRCVSEALRISQYVIHEGHKMKGFLRFKELENKVLYAEIEPTNDVILLVSDHFKRRLCNEYWIIRDVKRGLLSIYNKKKYIVVLEENFTFNTLTLSEEEKDIESLWKVFYKTIGIDARRNDRCRRNFMPKKYWKYILEVEDEL